MEAHLNYWDVSSLRFTRQGDCNMKGYLYVVEIYKNKEYVPYSVRKTQDAAELVRKNAERTTNSKYRVEKYERKRK